MFYLFIHSFFIINIIINIFIIYIFIYLLICLFMFYAGFKLIKYMQF